MNGLTDSCLISFLTATLICLSGQAFAAKCETVQKDHPELQIDPIALEEMASANISRNDFFHIMRIISKYETEGCWAGATGNADDQFLSAGVMQWNFGQGTLQPILKRYKEKFSSSELFEQELNALMPKFGNGFFDVSCRTIKSSKIKISDKCKSFLADLRHDQGNLHTEFKKEVDALFSSQTMKQIQVDYFARTLTSALSDLDRVFMTARPKGWQIAWTMDVKTQQGDNFPTDKNIKKIRNQTQAEPTETRINYINSALNWYQSLCDDGLSEGIRLDCAYNKNTWGGMKQELMTDSSKEETLRYTYLISKTATTQNGAYQANAFQRRASIVFGRGSVHGGNVDFSK